MVNLNNKRKGVFMEFFLSVIGMVLIIEGLPYFAFPDKMKSFLQKLPNMSSSHLRLFGFISTVLGLLLIYIARRVIGGS